MTATPKAKTRRRRGDRKVDRADLCKRFFNSTWYDRFHPTGRLVVIYLLMNSATVDGSSKSLVYTRGLASLETVTSHFSVHSCLRMMEEHELGSRVSQGAGHRSDIVLNVAKMLG